MLGRKNERGEFRCRAPLPIRAERIAERDHRSDGEMCSGKHVENKRRFFLFGSENCFSKNSRSKKRSLFLFVFFFSFEEDEEKTSVSFERVLRDHRRNSHRLPPPRASVIVRVIGRGMRDTRSYYML